MGKATLLIVEDEAIIRLCSVAAAEDEGYEVLEAADADEALRILSNRDDIALLVTDLSMPGTMDGLALANLASERWPSMKIVIVSGAANPQSKFPLLGKPYELDSFLDTIEQNLATG